MAPSSQITLIATFFFLFSPLSLASQNNPNKPFKKIYAFGDSYTDTGNTNSSNGPIIFRHSSSLPYGMTFFHEATNRYSDGRLVIDFVAEYLSLPFIQPYLNKTADKTHGVNFAVAGCTAIPDSFFVEHDAINDVIPYSLGSQLTMFDEYLEREAGCKDAKSTPVQCEAVFKDALVWVGAISANDYNYVTGTSATSKMVQRLSIKAETQFLKALLLKGAKYMVVQGLPTTGCLTLSLAFLAAPTDRDELGCVATKNKESYDHNVLLQAQLGGLRKQFPKSVIVFSDDWHAYREVIKNPSKYGIKQRFEACCGTGGAPYNFDFLSTCGAPASTTCGNVSAYINWDGLHCTEAMHKVVSKIFLDGRFSYPTFQHLLSIKQQLG